MNIDTYLDHIPLLHSWDGGATWNTGGFDAPYLRFIYEIATTELTCDRVILETGAGNSTICFLLAEPKTLISIAPDAALKHRILDYCGTHKVDVTPLFFQVEQSELALPNLALTHDPRTLVDLALIDGNHGLPTVFVDFCYINMLLKRDGILLLDDGPLYSVKELIRLLDGQPEFQFHSRRGKLWAFRKLTDAAFLPDFMHEPYITRMTQRDNRGGVAHSVGHPTLYTQARNGLKQLAVLGLKLAGRR